MTASNDDERATLKSMLEDAKAVVLRLETALARLDSGTDDDHPVVYWRKQRNMTQAALARRVGVSPAAICRIETSPGLAARKGTRKKLAEVLGVPEEWLLKPGSEQKIDRTAVSDQVNSAFHLSA